MCPRFDSWWYHRRPLILKELAVFFIHIPRGYHKMGSAAKRGQLQNPVEMLKIDTNKNIFRMHTRRAEGSVVLLSPSDASAEDGAKENMQCEPLAGASV